jgi:hypothetical protein
MSVSQLEKEFIEPSSAFRAKPFWAWNGKLEEPELRRQIRIFQAMGFGGFFMHSRVGLQTPYLSKEWFDLVKSCIDEAEKTKTQAWLYDEDRWPSGSAGGLVTKDLEYGLKILMMKRYNLPERYVWPEANRTVYVYGATFEDDKISWYKKLDQAADVTILPQGAEILEFSLENHIPTPWFNNTTYLDTMSEKAVKKFIDVTHEAYKKEVGEKFGKSIPGIFTDEPNRGPTFRQMWDNMLGLSWTSELPAKFQELFGYDILLKVPEIVFEMVGKNYSQVKYHYYCVTTRLFVENFGKQIGEWCEKNNLTFTGHVLEEQPLPNAVSVVGAAMQFYPYMQAPGIDMLSQYRLEYLTAKQCASAAHQTGRKWILSELYGCTGWEMTFEGYKHSGDWQAAMGITLRCPHLSWYTMEGEAKRDYPASIHFHSPWWKQYKHVEDYFSRLNTLLSTGDPICDLAVIHPIESFYLLYDSDWAVNAKVQGMDKQYTDMVKWLLDAHLDFHFADEQLMIDLNGKVDRDDAGVYLQIGTMKYRAVLVPPLVTIRKTTLDLLKTFAEAGGKVVFAGDAAGLVDAVESDEAKNFAQGKMVAMEAGAITASLEDSTRRISIRGQSNGEADDVLYQLRKNGEDWMIFIVNTNRENGHNEISVKLNVNLPKGGQIQLWDAESGKRFKVAGEITYKSADFKIDLPASGSRLVAISTESQDLPLYGVPKPTGKDIVIDENVWSYMIEDYNSVVLDRADATLVSEGKRKFVKTKMEILELDRAIRGHLGIELRGGAMTQPWAAKDDPLGPTGALTLSYKFNVKAIPSTPILLAIEQPERWTIKINDQVLSSATVSGYWVDPAIKTIMVSPTLLLKGKNFLTLEGEFDRHANLEIMYLLGYFGVDTDGKNVAMTKLPNKLKVGSWVEQGFPFYSGNMVYRVSLDVEPEAGKRYVLKFPSFKGTGIEVTVNGKEVKVTGWPNYMIDCTEALVSGKNTLDIKVLGTRRNSFGPLHQSLDKPSWVGPDSFLRHEENPEEWQDEFKLLPYGLLEPPVLMQCEA